MSKGIKMNRDLRDAWTNALRSGKYRQGRGKLHQAGKHCCLGVLRTISGGVMKGEDEQALREEDMFCELGTGLSRGDADTLAQLNDEGMNTGDPWGFSDKMGFDDIADYIEGEYV